MKLLYLGTYAEAFKHMHQHANTHTLHIPVQEYAAIYIQGHAGTYCITITQSKLLQIPLEPNSPLGESKRIPFLPLSLLSRSQLVDSRFKERILQHLSAYARMCNQLVS